MEIIGLFILFLIFSLLRAAAESGKKKPAGRPQRPRRMTLPELGEFDLSELFGLPRDVTSDAPQTAPTAPRDEPGGIAKQERRESAPQAAKRPGYQKPAPPRQAVAAVPAKKAEQFGKLLRRDTLVHSIIMSEVLGPPKSRRPGRIMR
ncbi:MAG TPA: hypothetical protein GX699_11605 [Firmicutes bacterium]|nr:hypothetical protein [Bacillota bacterium]